MYIKNLNINNFRNYRNVDISFNEKVNIIIGNNAQGKTNLLEAIYMTSLGKSFRTARDNEMIMFDNEKASIKAEIKKKNTEINLEINLFQKQKKIIKINGIKLNKNTDILENVYIVVFSPEDLKIVKDGPEKRRNFINRELCQIKPLYYHNLFKYSKLLLQRNAFLKNINIEKYDKNMLDIWNRELVEYGIKLIKERSIFIKKLNAISSIIHKNITNGKEDIELIYENNIYKKTDEITDKNIYLNKLEESIRKDFIRGNTDIGPHKDDIIIKVNNKDIRNYGSQGQQRTAALALKLAEIKFIEEETGETPILLLDDVLSELDAERQKFLINSLKDIQLFITTTEISNFIEKNLPENKIIKICNGTIEKI